MSGTLSGGLSVAGWALQAYASSLGSRVQVEPSSLSFDPALPIVGFERNEPFRRLLGNLRLDLPNAHLDPGVVYHWKGRSLVRPASVEGWVESGGEWFSGDGFRDWCEAVWNLSVASSNYIDVFGKEPSEPPFGYPYLYPSAWQGFSRNRLLLRRAGDFAAAFEVEPRLEFRAFLDAQVRFAYGRGMDDVTVGMAAAVWNAPSVSYRLYRQGAEPQPVATPSAWRRSSTAWRLGTRAGAGLGTDAPHQVFFEDPAPNPDCRTAVLTLNQDGRGYLYYRSGPGGLDRLKAAMDHALGEGWGELEGGDPLPLPGLRFRIESREEDTQAEAEWPWLGPVRAYLEARRPLV